MNSDYLVSVCNNKNMYMSGGSDFHGTRKINHNLGTGNNNLNIDESVVDNWVGNYIPSFDSNKNIK